MSPLCYLRLGDKKSVKTLTEAGILLIYKPAVRVLAAEVTAV